MKFTERYTEVFRRLLPSPFTIALVLTLFTLIIAWLHMNASQGWTESGVEVLTHWKEGLWNRPLMVFAMQMMLMLVLGHVLALTEPVNRIIGYALQYCTNTSRAALTVTLLTVIVSLFNWGLGLIFGAIFARKVGEYAAKHRIAINYPLIGAAGYSGLMVWHGGISGSSLVKVAESGHLHQLMEGIDQTSVMATLPERISFGETVFSPMNLTVSLIVILVLPAFMYWIGSSTHESAIPELVSSKPEIPEQEERIGAEKLDHSRIVSLLFGGIILLTAFLGLLGNEALFEFSFITPDFINLMLLGLGLVLHRNVRAFVNAVGDAIEGAAGILIQFPLYFGIMGVMKGSGLIQWLSDIFVGISSPDTFPIFTFFSAGLVNIFVPSGGGQWAVQGPIIVQAAADLGVSLPKCILALAYGDQLTNMLQPFWALPLLGITGLKAKEILPYTLYLLLAGLVIYITALWIF